MCINTMVKIYPKKDKTEGFGWKVFNKYKGGILGTAVFGIPMKKGKVYRRKINDIISGSQITYESGFHIFVSRKDARLYREEGEVVIKVRYKGIVCDGYELANKDDKVYNLKTRVVKQLELV